MEWHESSLVYAGRKGLTVVRQDPYKKLVWVGDDQGYVSSFYGPSLTPYTSFLAHNSGVRDLAISETGVVSLSANGLSIHRRNGLVVAKSEDAGGEILLYSDGEVLVGSGHRVNRYITEPSVIETGTFTLEDVGDDVSLKFMARASPYYVLGLSNGRAQIVDPMTFESTLDKPLTCHTGTLTSFDCQKSILMTCGTSARRYGVVQDSVVFVYDVRTQKTLPLLSVPTGALYVCIHPKAPAHCLVVSGPGQLTWLDVKNPGSIEIKQAALTSELIGVSQNSNADGVVLAEEDGMLHYWTKNAYEEPRFTGVDVPSLVGPLPTLTSDTPLSAVGMPYYSQELLSSWSDPGYIFDVGMPVPEWSMWPALRANKHQNMDRHRRGSMPRFISQGGGGSAASWDSQQENDGAVPRVYRQLSIQYSKFGVEDFDFRFFNSTEYSGLETLPNSPHGNAVLQFLRWCAPLHNELLKTFALHNYDSKLVVIGELAILFDMLHKASGRQCQASNLASALLEGAPIAPGQLADYILRRAINEHADLAGIVEITQQTRAYGSCGFRDDSADTLLLPKTRGLDEKALASALGATTDSLEYCPKCDKHHSIVKTRQLKSASPALLFSVDADASGELCTEFRLVQRADKRTYRIASASQNLGEQYRLLSYVADIAEKHSVCVVRMGEQWFVFNDFCVAPISAEDATLFSSFKRPRLLLYGTDRSDIFDYESWKTHIDKRLLYEPQFVSGNLSAPPPAPLLKPDETPPRLVALDAEFVLLNQEVAEIHSDGTKSLLQPRTLSLARVSVLRGDNHQPFIDDFVQAKVPVVDYLTAFSGIEPGDLDPDTSPYGLVARHTAARRLWILLNLGCIFVGHALYNDFRTINLIVPPDQIVDTAVLYHPEELKARKLSLKFLMWAVLGDQIQLGNHDSVEDALSALLLYEHYLKLESTGGVDDMLVDIMAKGLQSNFRVPVVP